MGLVQTLSSLWVCINATWAVIRAAQYPRPHPESSYWGGDATPILPCRSDIHLLKGMLRQSLRGRLLLTCIDVTARERIPEVCGALVLEPGLAHAGPPGVE